MKLLSILLLITSLNSTFAKEVLKQIDLSGDKGSRVDGSPWSSSEIKGKVYALFYVDPDEKDLNEHAAQALKKEKFPREKYGSIAVINMAANWSPNFILDSVLEGKQEEYPDTIYVKDLDKHLVKEWSLKDDSSNIVIFDKEGNAIYKILGKASDKQVKEMLEIVKSNL